MAIDFYQYLQKYLEAKRLRGVTPGQGASTALFAPYFNRQAAGNIEGRRLDLAERAQASKEKQQAEGLAWQKENSQQRLAWQKESAGQNLAWQKESAGQNLAWDKESAGQNLAWQKESAGQNLAWQKESAGQNLAWDKERVLNQLLAEKWYQDELKKQAASQDRRETTSNVISGLGSFAKYPLYKRMGYL